MEPTKNRPTGSTPPSTPQSDKTGAQGGSLAADAKELATHVADRAKDLASEQVTGQQEKSAGQIGKVASALHRTSTDLADSVAGPYIEKAAALLDKVSGSVRTADLRSAVRSTESFARREPLLFLGGAFALGLVAARFLKSSSHRDDDLDMDDTEGQSGFGSSGYNDGSMRGGSSRRQLAGTSDSSSVRESGGGMRDNGSGMQGNRAGNGSQGNGSNGDGPGGARKL
ncbi:MAG: hypothetical protein H0T46_34830 [Deltaproteobacteria bacterium]|nr:hypothetical protein [Deltaproteobacteria bacterium]